MQTQTLRCPPLPLNAGPRHTFWLCAWMRAQGLLENLRALTATQDFKAQPEPLKTHVAGQISQLTDLTNSDVSQIKDDGMLLFAHAGTTMVAA